MAWKDKEAEKRWKESRKDPKFVEEKKKYLNEWYKKNRKKQLAYQKKRRLENLELSKQIKKRTYLKRKNRLRALGLNINGNPILSKEEQSKRLSKWGKLGAAALTKKQRQQMAYWGHKAQAANRKKKREEVLKKIEDLGGVEAALRHFKKSPHPQSKPRQRQKEA